MDRAITGKHNATSRGTEEVEVEGQLITHVLIICMQTQRCATSTQRLDCTFGNYIWIGIGNIRSKRSDRYWTSVAGIVDGAYPDEARRVAEGDQNAIVLQATGSKRRGRQQPEGLFKYSG